MHAWVDEWMGSWMVLAHVKHGPLSLHVYVCKSTRTHNLSVCLSLSMCIRVCLCVDVHVYAH